MIKNNLSDNKLMDNLSREMRSNVFVNYILRGITILLGLVSTRVNLSYLGMSLYGQWATIASVASWINYGDFGIGNGFRNEFAKAAAEGDKGQQKKLLVSTALMTGRLSIGLFFVLLAVTEIIFATDTMNSSLRVPMYITNFSFCLDLFLGLGRFAAYGYQKSWLTSLAQTVTVTFRIVGVLFLGLFSTSLTSFSIINGVGGAAGNLLLLIVLYRTTDISFENKLKSYIDKGLRKTIVGKGLQFFILQIASLVLYSSDSLIINRFITSEAVTEYSLITKIYTTGESLFSIVLISLWSAVTYAVSKKNYKWIKDELKKLLQFWSVFVCGVILVSISFNGIISIWLGKNAVIYDASLITLFAVYTVWGTFGSIFVNIANGVGRLKTQLMFSTIEAVVNIPLSIFFAVNLGMGIFGVKLATLCCCVGANIFVPIDMVRYLNKVSKDKGDAGDE